MRRPSATTHVVLDNMHVSVVEGGQNVPCHAWHAPRERASLSTARWRERPGHYCGKMTRGGSNIISRHSQAHCTPPDDRAARTEACCVRHDKTRQEHGEKRGVCRAGFGVASGRPFFGKPTSWTPQRRARGHVQSSVARRGTAKTEMQEQQTEGSDTGKFSREARSRAFRRRQVFSRALAVA